MRIADCFWPAAAVIASKRNVRNQQAARGLACYCTLPSRAADARALPQESFGFLAACRGLSAMLATIMAAISVTSHEKYIQSKKRGNAAKAP